jgi:hypothetical protein
MDVAQFTDGDHRGDDLKAVEGHQGRFEGLSHHGRQGGRLPPANIPSRHVFSSCLAFIRRRKN